MNRKEQQRIIVLNRVESRELTAAQAGELMGLSVRQVRRLLAAYRREGVVAIAHGNRGRRPPHTVSEAVRERVVALAAGPYDGANHTHLSELMAEREGLFLFLSRSTVRRVLLQAGIKTPRRRRAPKHRRRRERYPQEGMMLQVDGSRHDWLQGRGPWLTLIGGIDDATGTVPYGCFREQEDSYGYMQLLQGVIQRKGIPLTLYSDRHSTFTVSRAQNETLEEQLTGQTPQTQVGRALNELGVRLVLAHSPQAKGRIERLWGDLPGPAADGAAPGRSQHARGGQCCTGGLPATVQLPVRRSRRPAGCRLPVRPCGNGPRWHPLLQVPADCGG